MIDLIVYMPNLIKFRKEALNKANEGVVGFYLDEDGQVVYAVDKLPVKYFGNKSLSIIRLNDDQLAVFDTLTTAERIGKVVNDTYIFDVGGELKYNSVHTRPVYTDELGNEIQEPYYIGLFKS